MMIVMIEQIMMMKSTTSMNADYKLPGSAINFVVN